MTTRCIVDLWSGEPVGQAVDHGPEAAPVLAAQAVAAFEQLRVLPAHRRADALDAATRRLSERGEAAARLVTAESGKPIRMARREVQRAVGVLTEASAVCRTQGGAFHRLDGTGADSGRVAVSARFPIGPVLAITPANSPLNLVVHKVAPAVAAGCSIVVKPHERTPLSAALVAELFCDVLPEHAVVVAPGGATLGAALVAEPAFRVLSFTGSPIGWRLAAADPTRRALLELGGNAAVIVCADADLRQAARATIQGGTHNSGQSCVSAQRILVADEVLDEFTALLLEACAEVVLGDPSDEAVDIGPLPQAELDRLESIVDAAVARGARVLTGGRRQDRCMPPTVLADVDGAGDVWRDEVFGPIICLAGFSGLDEAIERANDSDFGLQSGVFTRDATTAWTLFERLEVGGVVIGDSSDSRSDPLPYGGWKRSGAGREGVRWAIEAYTDLRTLTFTGVGA